MALTPGQYEQLQAFFNKSQFEEKGAVITDLDGTVIHEYEGRFSIPQSVELGLNKIYDLGRPVILNTLRFPLSVIRTFGKDWYKISNAAIPTVLMNGSQLGYIIQTGDGIYEFDEIAAFPLEKQEINHVITVLKGLLGHGADEILVFYYPRNWRSGELIWTPLEEKVDQVKRKYRSASSVHSCGIEKFSSLLLEEDICMIFLLLDVPHDKLMAYQHTKKNNFFTHKGVDKRSGAEQMAIHLGFDLAHSVGAGDSPMDNFLNDVGLAIHVNNPYLEFESLFPAVRLKNSSELGELLFELADMQRTIIH
jgi:hydroxymethylpyrimidine pyrophosphatase-like HAD family hydrolase